MQGKERAGYGESLIESLASDLTAKFGRGFSRSNMFHMRDFYAAWPIVQTLSGESSGRGTLRRTDGESWCSDLSSQLKRKKTVTKRFSQPCNCRKMGSAFERKQVPRIGVRV